LFTAVCNRTSRFTTSVVVYLDSIAIFKRLAARNSEQNAGMAPRKGTIPPNKLSAGVEELVAKAYAIDRSSRRVADRFGIAKGTVLRIAHERGITVPAWGISKEIAECLLKTYLGGKSGPEVAAEFNTTPTTVYAHLIKAGKPRRSISEYDQEEKCNHDYFDIIDRPEKAYWIGMLLADGCISREHEVILSLNVRDIEMIRAFKKAFGSNSHITIQKQLKSVRGGKEFLSTSAAIRVRSRRLCAALAGYGILPGKTFRPRMAKGIPPQFERHFWRGAVDGDGWVVLSNRPNGSIQFIVGFTGDKKIVRAFQHFCRQQCPTRAQIKPNGPIHQFVITDWFAFDVARLMYGKSTISLRRKHDRYKTALALFRNRTRHLRNWS
jgi:hypothetical protein